jgi:hypothetical protein
MIPTTVENYFASLVDELDNLNLSTTSYIIHYITVESVLDEDNQTINYNTVIKDTIAQLNECDYHKIKKSISQYGTCKHIVKNISNQSVFVKVPTSDFFKIPTKSFFLYPLEAISKDTIDIVKIKPVK